MYNEYEEIFEELCDRVENEELTLEETEAINNYAYEAYVVEDNSDIYLRNARWKDMFGNNHDKKFKIDINPHMRSRSKYYDTDKDYKSSLYNYDHGPATKATRHKLEMPQYAKDYYTANKENGKDARYFNDTTVELGKEKKNGQKLIGFALETENESINAEKKLKAKNFDFIVLNSLKDKNAGFQHDTNKVTIIKQNGEKKEFGLKTKKEVAADIVNELTRN